VISKVFDMCGGRPLSIRDTVELLDFIAGGEARLQFSAVADRPLDLCPSGELASRRRAVCTTLEDGIRKSVAWYSGDLMAPPRPDRGPATRIPLSAI
jgi:hypothetical protein